MKGPIVVRRRAYGRSPVKTAGDEGSSEPETRKSPVCLHRLLRELLAKDPPGVYSLKITHDEGDIRSNKDLDRVTGELGHTCGCTD